MSTTTKPPAKRGRAKRRPEPLTVAEMQRKREVDLATGAARGPEQSEPSALDELGVRLSELLYPGRGGESVQDSPDQHEDVPPPLTVGEVSMLLQGRERFGWERGYGEGQQAARRNFGLRLARDRAESVAGALIFCVDTITPVIERMAGTADVSGLKSLRLELVELVAAMSRHAQRIADGDEQLSL